MNGFAVSQRLKQVSGGVLQVSDGSLYPALHKLEQEGWITDRVKNVRVWAAGEILFADTAWAGAARKKADNWGRLSSAISRVIKLKEA